MRSDVDDRVAVVAAAQKGLFSRDQVIAAAGDDKLIGRRLGSGRWLHVGPGVYSLPGHPKSFLRRIWQGHLTTGPHSVVSHQTAAALHRLPGFPRRECVLTVPHSGWHRVEGTFVHQITDLAPDEITNHDGLPLTDTTRTIVDLAPWVGFARLDAAAEAAVAAGQTTYASIGRATQRVARRGKPGIRQLAALLEMHGPGSVPAQSTLERDFLKLLHSAGLPPPERQIALPGRGVIDGWCDFAYPDARLLIEVDGRRWHTRVQDLRRDRQRDREAARAGWETLRFLFEEVHDDPTGTIDDVRSTLAERTALFSTQ